MTDDTEWGPIVEHDGKGFPQRLYGWEIELEAEQANGKKKSAVGVVRYGSPVGHWDWANFRKWSGEFCWHWARVIRYRVRKPRALKQLRDMVENLPAPERVKEEV